MINTLGLRSWDGNKFTYYKSFSEVIPQKNVTYMLAIAKVLHKDSNNISVEQILFENDIVEVKYKSHRKELIKVGIVIYNQDYGSYMIKWNQNKHQHHMLLSDYWIDIKIIGNVYEDDFPLSDGSFWN